jgi:hypothetical protein
MLLTLLTSYLRTKITEGSNKSQNVITIYNLVMSLSWNISVEPSRAELGHNNFRAEAKLKLS